MALSDSAQRKDKVYKKRALTAGHGVAWSDGQRLEAVQTYLMLGSVRLASAMLKIPEPTFKFWRTQAWWKDLEAELKLQDELKLSTSLKRVIDKSMEAVEDRLDKGNYVYDQKTGKIKRVPVNLRDAHKVAIDSILQKDLIANRNVEKANDGQIEDKLLKLAEKFAAMAAKKFVEITDEERTVEVGPEDVTDVELVSGYSEQEVFDESEEDVEIFQRSLPVSPFVKNKEEQHAIHDQRETGLQEGKPAVQQQT